MSVFPTQHRITTILLGILSLAILSSLPFQGTAYANKYENEGAGLLHRDLDGALPKALWNKQPRSEIVYLLQNLPASSHLRSVQEVKRNMLLSSYDTSLIDNDMPIKDGEDLLSLRLSKLMEMGLWEDAFTLYTTTTEDPGKSAKLAEIGILLILTQKGLSTACLEGKVLSPRFPDNAFWDQIDNICAIELGMATGAPPEFTSSSVLQAIFYNKDFKIAANDIAALDNLSSLELALLSLKEGIIYQSLDLSQRIPPHIIKTFIKDSHFPNSKKKALNQVAQRIALLPPADFTEKHKKQLENVLKLPQNMLLSLLEKKLRLHQDFSSHEINRALKLAPTNPENYFYFQLLKSIKPIGSTMQIPDITTENSDLGMGILSTKNIQKVDLLKTLLDKTLLFSNNLGEVYEKQLSLTPEGHYVMPTGDLIKWLDTTQKHQFTGLSLLIILSNIENNAYAASAEVPSTHNRFNMLKRLSTVGLIDQAHHIAREELANLMAQ